jgi:hypothetical protein
MSGVSGHSFDHETIAMCLFPFGLLLRNNLLTTNNRLLLISIWIPMGTNFAISFADLLLYCSVNVN